MKTKTQLFLFAILLICNGCYILLNRGGSVYGQPLSPYFGLILLGFGLVTLFYSFKVQNVEKYICVHCEKIIKSTKGKEVRCPKCGTRMEPLKGFYDRHPELKEKFG